MLYTVTITKAGTLVDQQNIIADCALSACSRVEEAYQINTLSLQLCEDNKKRIVGKWNGYCFEAREHKGI